MMARAAGPKRQQDKPSSSTSYLCPYCGKTRRASEFYSSSDPLIQTGLTVMCKDCAEKIARNWNAKTRSYGDCTKVSMQEALQRLDKPWLERVWESSYFEYTNQDTRATKSVWSIYIRNVSGPAYGALRWRDGDIFNAYVESAKNLAGVNSQGDLDSRMQQRQDIDNECAKNRADVIKLLGYDPFEKEAENDKPLLYSQLIGYLDLGGDGNDDMMRTSSAITIVRGFLQQSKIDDKITEAMDGVANGRTSEIKTLLDSKQKLSTTISQLAEQSCLSLKHSKNASKGDNTWTGKIKKIKELNLREGEVNGFDIATCKGMRQVMDMSNASILKQLNLDESEYSDMLAQQRVMVTNAIDERDKYKEIARILLRENIDLRDVLEENRLLDKDSLVDLDDLYTCFRNEQLDGDEESDGGNDE